MPAARQTKTLKNMSVRGLRSRGEGTRKWKPEAGDPATTSPNTKIPKIAVKAGCLLQSWAASPVFN